MASSSSSLAFSICRARRANWAALPAKNLSLNSRRNRLLGVGLRDCGAVEVGSLALVSFDQALFGHDLQEFEDAGVDDGPAFVDGFK